MTGGRGRSGGSLSGEDLNRRLERADPLPMVALTAERIRYERALRDAITSSPAPGPRRSRRRRRSIAVVATAVLLATAAIAAAVLTRSSPPEVTQAAGLDPGSIPAELRPLPGSAPHLLVSFEFEGRTWEVWGSDTRGGTDLVHVLAPGPDPRAVGSSGCPTPEGALRVCAVSHGGDEQTVVGRVTDDVGSVTTVAVDGASTPATLNDGFFLSVTGGRGDAVADRVVASDAGGDLVASAKVTIMDGNGNVVRAAP